MTVLAPDESGMSTVEYAIGTAIIYRCIWLRRPKKGFDKGIRDWWTHQAVFRHVRHRRGRPLWIRWPSELVVPGEHFVETEQPPEEV